MPAEGRENPLLKKGNSDAFFREKYLTKNKQVILGIYQKNSHRVVPSTDCMLQSKRANQVPAAILQVVNANHFTPYDEDRGTGLLRHVVVRVSADTQDVMVTVVTSSPVFPGSKNFVRQLVQLCPFVKTVVQNINTSHTTMVLGKGEKVLYGNGHLLDKLLGHTFSISSQSFYQVNPAATQILYQHALNMANIGQHTTFLDAYCGTGTIGICAAAAGGQGTGVELNPRAVADAVQNAKCNHIHNMRFVCMDAGKYLSQLRTPVNVLFVDPPRSGCSAEFINSVGRAKPSRIVYISCNPETQVRDIKQLLKKGYCAQYCQPVDMFPHTDHVETVVLLSKGEIDSKKVRVEFSLEDMDMSGFQKGATYEQIKTYVLEHTGLKVSSLYISQVKRKCGLDVGQNYNLSKKEDAKVPQCPPEKEAAIMEALKHFQMLE